MLGENEWVLADAETFNAAMKQLGPRRTRLLAAASCRLMVPLLEPPRDRIALDALNTVELFADTGKTKAALKRARKAVSEARESLWRDSPDPGSGSEALWAIQTALSERTPADAVRRSVAGMMLARGLGLHAGWRLFYGPYRDIAGLPPGLAFDPAWRTSTVIALARQMYESRDFAAMPILADALQDAGCDSDSVLSHYRGPDKPNNGFPPNIPTAAYVHVRGCWVIDLILGKG